MIVSLGVSTSTFKITITPVIRFLLWKAVAFRLCNINSFKHKRSHFIVFPFTFVFFFFLIFLPAYFPYSEFIGISNDRIFAFNNFLRYFKRYIFFLFDLIRNLSKWFVIYIKFTFLIAIFFPKPTLFSMMFLYFLYLLYSVLFFIKFTHSF